MFFFREILKIQNYVKNKEPENTLVSEVMTLIFAVLFSFFQGTLFSVPVGFKCYQMALD